VLGFKDIGSVPGAIVVSRQKKNPPKNPEKIMRVVVSSE
jgi:hypothetical protein